MKKVQQIVHQWSWAVLLAFCTVGLFFPAIGVIALLCMMAPVFVAFYKGRRWCGVYCPRGSFNDVILSKITARRQIPALFKKSGFKLFFLIFLMGAFAAQLFLAWGNNVSTGMVFVRMVIITTLLALILGTIFKQRTWCLICPMGTMACYVARMEAIRTKINHIAFDKNKCIHCKVCTKNCPMTIDVYSYKEAGRVVDADCLKCQTCISKCPRKSLYVA